MGLILKKKPKYKIGKNPLLREPTIIYSNNVIGDNFQTGHFVVIRQDNKIGNNVSIGIHSEVAYNVIIEDNVRIHSKCFIPEFSVIKKNAWIGPNVVFTNDKYPNSIDGKNNLKGPIIGEYANIGANSTILPGIKIGKHALIGAGTVVVKDVPDYAIVVGNPNKIIGDVRNLEKYEISE